MSEPAWLADLGATLIAKADPALATTYQATFDGLVADAAGYSDAALTRVQGKFISATMGRALAPALAAPVAATAAVSAAIDAVRDVLDGPLDVLDDLRAHAAPLKAASDAAWQACRIAAGVVRTAKTVEKIAAIAAFSGFPGVVGAWAVATDARMAAEVVAENAAAAGRAADQAYGAVLHAIDAVRGAVLAPINAMSRVADAAVSSITAGLDSLTPIQGAYGDLMGDLRDAVTAAGP